MSSSLLYSSFFGCFFFASFGYVFQISRFFAPTEEEVRDRLAEFEAFVSRLPDRSGQWMLPWECVPCALYDFMLSKDNQTALEFSRS